MAKRKVKEEQIEKKVFVEAGIEEISPATKTLFTKENVPFRSQPIFDKKYLVGTSTRINTGYGIVKEIKNINGSFYLLDNGYYIAQNSRAYIIV